jgi:hypothetical protein
LHFDDPHSDVEVAELQPTANRHRARPALWGVGIALVIVVAAAVAISGGGTTWTSNRVVLSQAATRTAGAQTAQITGA